MKTEEKSNVGCAAKLITLPLDYDIDSIYVVKE